MPLARKLISSFYCYVERLLVLGVEFPFGRTRRESTRDEAKKKGKKEKKRKKPPPSRFKPAGKEEREKTCSKGKKSSCSRAFFVLLSIEHERKKRTHDPSHGYVGNTFFFLLLLLLTSHVHVLHILHLSPSRATAPRSVPFSFRGGARSVYLEYGLLFLGTVLTFLPRVNVFVHVPDVGIRSPSTSRLSVFCRCFGDE